MLFLLASCEESDVTTSNLIGGPPVAGYPIPSIYTINIDSIVQTGSEYQIVVDVRVRVTDPDGRENIHTVEAQIFRPSGGSPFLTQFLHDTGTLPDSTPGDGTFAGSISFATTRAQTGLYRLRIEARDINNLRSTRTECTLLITRNNSHPYLIAQSLVAPDTLTVPSSGTSFFFVSIAAADSDGLADINEVYLQNLNTLNRDNLFDDGGATQSNGISSGDVLAGDGIFSITLQLPSTVPPGIYPFALQAVDSYGDTSAGIAYSLTIQQ